MKTPKDQYNQPIEVGDIITYPARKKNDLYNRTAKVLEILPPETGENITRLKVMVAIVPRAEERRKNRYWKNNIKYVKTILKNTWKSSIVSECFIEDDPRYYGLLEQ